MSNSTESVTAEQYRSVMRHWPSGVTVVTMLDEGAPHGMTVSAFTSVSVDPPLVLIVVDKRWRSHGYLTQGGVFCVNILAEDQLDLSDRFAGRQGDLPDRFVGLARSTAVSGAPVLDGAVAWLDCRLAEQYDAGDHTVFLGRVVAAAVPRETAQPLLYHNTRYKALAHLGP